MAAFNGEDVDLSDQRLQERADVGRKVRQERTQRGGRGLAGIAGGRGHDFLAAAADRLKGLGLLLDLAAKAEHRLGHALEEELLLLLKQVQQAAVTGELLAEHLDEGRPGWIHGFAFSGWAPPPVEARGVS